MKIKKRKEAVVGEPSSEMTKVKDEPISPDDVICLSDNSNSAESSDSSDSSESSTDSSSDSSTDSSTDDDKDSSDAEDLKIVVHDGGTQFSVKFATKMSMIECRRMYLVIRRIVRRNKIPNDTKVIDFHIKKRKKVIRKEKKKRPKNKKTESTKSTDKCNSADKTEPKIEPKTEIVEENEIQPNPPVWVEPLTPQPEKTNSAPSLELSKLKDKIITSDCNNEIFLLGNVDANRIKIATNNPSSFRRYEDLNNGDLDYIEETMDLNLPIAEGLVPKNSLIDTERFSSLSAQNTSQSSVQTINNTSFEQDIKYEPELIISEDEEGLRSAKNIPNVPSMEKIKDEPLEVDSQSANLGIGDQMTNTALIDLEPVLIKNEPIKEEPMSSKDDIITLSDDEDDHKKPMIETSCTQKIETEKSGNNSTNIVNHCKNLSKDAEVADSDDDDLKYHETRRNQQLKKISVLPEDEETSHEHLEEGSTDSPKKRNLVETVLSSDTDSPVKNLAAKKKRRTKIARIESDSEMDATDEEAALRDLLGNESNESNIKNVNQKETYVRRKSREEIKPLNEKMSHDEKKSLCNKRCREETEEFDEETSSVKKRRSDEKFADKKKIHENMSREKSEVGKICRKEKSEVGKICRKEKSEAENICKKEKSEVEKICKKEKSKEEISDRFNKAEHKVKSHKSDVKRRHSSEAKSTKISESNNCNLNENSSCTKTAVASHLIPCGNPVVVLTKLDEQIQIASPSESVNPIKDKSNIKNITKSSIKQEAQTASTRSGDIQDTKRKISTPEPKYLASKSTPKVNRDFTPKSKSETKHDLDINKTSTKQETQAASMKTIDSLDIKRKVSTPEPKCPASQPTKKFNCDWTLKSETETEHDPEKDQQRRKSENSVSVDKLNTSRIEQNEGGPLNDLSMQILIEQSQKKVEEIQNFAINSGVTIVKLQMTMEARGNLVNEESGKSAKQFVEFKQTSSVHKHFDERDNLSQCSEEKERKDKASTLEKEIAVNQKISPADFSKFSSVKSEKRQSLDSDNRESFTDAKATSGNRSNVSRINAERRKSLDPQQAEKITPKKTNFPYDVERKPVTSFVGKIPKKTAVQSNVSPIGTTPNCPGNISAHTSNEVSSTCEGKSPIENTSLSKPIINTSGQMAKETQQQNTQKVQPLLPKFSPKIPRTLFQFEQIILHWEPAWFKENNGNVIRKLFGENYVGMRPTYESYDDFYQDAESLLAIKILDPLTCDREKYHFKYSIVKGSIYPRKIPNTDVEMTTFKLDIVLSKRDSLNDTYPLDGDLICLKYHSTDMCTKSVVENEIFALIESVRSEIISERTFFKPHLRNFVYDPYELRTYSVITRCIHDQRIHAKRIGKMTMIPNCHFNLESFSALKNLLHSPLLNHIVHPKVEDYQLPDISTQYYALATKDNLDAQQLDAVAKITETAITRDPKICLIEGPPGTGKTKVVINIVRQLINCSGKLDKNRPFRILVCAPSNSAVDEIAMRLLEERQKIAKDKKGDRFRMVRVGVYGSINPKVKEISLEDLTKKEFDRFNDAAMKYDYEKMRKSMQFHSDQDYELRIQKSGAKYYSARNHISRKMEDNKARWDFLKSRKWGTDNPLNEEERKSLYRAAESTVLEGAQVVVCTLACSAKNCMASVFGGTENGFSTCIIDESTKSSEDETLLPLQLGVKTLILVGDPIQQPHSASIMPGETKLHDLDRSLFARLRQAFADHSENPIIQFQAQYRMAYPVAYWPQQYFYDGNLHSCANLRCLPLERYKVMNLDFTQEDNEGTTNEYEGVFVANLVMILMTRAGLDLFEQPVRIGVITPFHRQKTLIYNEIKLVMDRLPTELKQKIIVDVNTIDGIQGQERDVIIMSCVASNGTRLLSDKQKVCMALTRAKNSMILCGNFRTYWKDPMWESLLNEAQSRHFYVNVPRHTHKDDIVAHIVR